MSDDLYNDAILAEAKAKIGAGRLNDPTVTVECDNPLCGDRVTLDVELEDGCIGAIAHKTRGCLLTRAAASALARHAQGARGEDIDRAAAQVRALLAGEDVDVDWQELAMFRPVGAVKSRHECVLLPFDAAQQAIRRARQPGD